MCTVNDIYSSSISADKKLDAEKKEDDLFRANIICSIVIFYKFCL